MSKVCPSRISQARELAGHSKTDLAEYLTVSPAAVAQWETGVKQPTAENVFGIAKFLSVPVTMLSKQMPQEISRKGPLSFRGWNSAQTRKINRQYERLAELIAESFMWLDSFVTFPNLSIPDTGTSSSIEEVATECRRAWGLGDRPLHKLGELLQSKGFAVVRCSIEDARLDGFSCVINGRPFIFLGAEKGDRARSRFDCAHELGHLILHQHFTEVEQRDRDTHNKMEEEAHKFASAFLLPATTFGPDVTDPTLNGFLKLKPKWGVSVQAMVRRSLELGMISAIQYQELCRQVGYRGWRKPKGEPFDDVVPEVVTDLPRKSLELLEKNNVIRRWDVPSDLPFPKHILENLFQTKFEWGEDNIIQLRQLKPDTADATFQ